MVRAMRKVFACIISAIMVLSSVPSALADNSIQAVTADGIFGNIVKNGGFENEGIVDGRNGWRVFDPNAAYERVTDVSYEGSAGSLKFSGSYGRTEGVGNGSFKTQSMFGHTFKARLNQWYKYSYKVRNQSADDGTNIQVYYGNYDASGDVVNRAQITYIKGDDNSEGRVRLDKGDLGWHTVEGYFQITDTAKCTDEADEDYWYRDVVIYSAMYWASSGTVNVYIDDVSLVPVYGTVNSDFSECKYDGKTIGWDTPGTVMDIINAPEKDSSFPTGAKMMKVTQHVSNKQKVALESNQKYILSAWVMVPKTGSPYTRISFYEDSNGITGTQYTNSAGKQINTAGSGSLAAYGNAGIYVPNDGNWYHIVSTIEDGYADLCGRTHFDTQIYIAAANSQTGSATSGEFNSSELYVAEFSVKPLGNNLVAYPGNMYYAKQPAAYRPVTAAVLNASNAAANKTVGKTAYLVPGTETTFADVLAAEDMNYIIMTQMDATKSALVHAGQYKYKAGYTYTYSADIRVDGSADADTAEVYFCNWNQISNSRMAVTKQWQHFEYTTPVYTSNDGNLGIKVFATEDRKQVILDIKNFTITETPTMTAPAQISVSISYDNVKTGFVPTVVLGENGCNECAFTYKYYSSTMPNSERTVVLAGQTAVGGEIPSLAVDESMRGLFFTLEVTPLSVYGVYGERAESLCVSFDDFKLNDVKVTKTDGTPLDFVRSTQQAAVSVTAVNTLSEPENVTFVAASYSKDMMQSVVIEKIELFGEKEVRFKDHITISEETDKVKVMLLNGDDIKPLCKSAYADLRSYTQPTVACWGDSLTAGSGASDRELYSYPAVLSKLSGAVVYNMGIGGETSTTIAARQGALDIVITEDTVIPESGGCEISFMASNGGFVTPKNTTYGGWNPCTINGVEGTITVELNTEKLPHTVKRAVFTRTESGEPVAVKKGDKLIPEAQSVCADINVIFTGANGGWTPANTTANWGDEAAMAELIELIRVQAAMSKNPDKYIVIGSTTGDTNSRRKADTAMKEAFGEHFLNLREYLADEEVLRNAGVELTDEDLTSISKGAVPGAILVDSIHYNDTGYELIGAKLYETMASLGYMN